MEIDLIHCSPARLAEEVELDALLASVRAIETWQERHAEVLDTIYRHRVSELLRRGAAEDELLPLSRHLARVAHPRRQEQLERLRLPYYTRWLAFRDLLEDRLAVLDSGAAEALLQRAHVPEILTLVVKGEVATQRELEERLDLKKANLSRILTAMERAELVVRRRRGRENLLLPGALGMRHEPEPAAIPTVQRGLDYLKSAA